LSFFIRLHVFYDLNLHGLLRQIHWRNFQHGNESRPFILCAVQMPSCVSAFGLWVSGQVENLNIALPGGIVIYLSNCSYLVLSSENAENALQTKHLQPD